MLLSLTMPQTPDPLNKSKVRPSAKNGADSPTLKKPSSRPKTSKLDLKSDRVLSSTPTSVQTPPPPSISSSHRDLVNCPCGRSSSGNSWVIDCSKCGQHWHANCLGMKGITDKAINKMLEYLCPFCYVAPVPTMPTSEDVCYICRNTLSLQQANSQLETSITMSNIDLVAKCSELLKGIDFGELFAKIDTLGQFDLRLRHLLLSENALHSLESEIKRLSDLLSSSTPATESLNTNIKSFTESLTSHDTSIITLTNKLHQHMHSPTPTTSLNPLIDQISQLQKEVVALSSLHTGPLAFSAESDQLIERVSSELRSLCEREDAIAADISVLKQSVTALHSSPHPPPPCTTIPTSQPLSHNEPFISKSVTDFLDEETEKDLIELLQSKSDQFRQENGRSVLAFGVKYNYPGSKSSHSPQTLPHKLYSLCNRLNQQHSADIPPINSVLVNRYDGSSAFLPQHSDNESVIHPDSAIYTVSIGTACTVSFCNMGSTDVTATHACPPRSMYAMSRKSQDLFEHRIDLGAVSHGTRYSLTFRTVHHLNRASTIIIGDSNTCSFKFGEDPKKSFGKYLPGKQVYAPLISDIEPIDTCGYMNVAVLCGINNIKQTDVKTPADIKKIFNCFVNKINNIQAANKKAHVYVCPLLPTKCTDLNRRVNFFNHLIFTELLPLNFGVTLVSGFGCLIDDNGFLSQDLSRKVTRFGRPDYLHLNWRGVAKVAAILRNTILLRVNGGQDKRLGRRGRRVDGALYADVARNRTDRQPQDGYQSE